MTIPILNINNKVRVIKIECIIKKLIKFKYLKWNLSKKKYILDVENEENKKR